MRVSHCLRNSAPRYSPKPYRQPPSYMHTVGAPPPRPYIPPHPGVPPAETVEAITKPSGPRDDWHFGERVATDKS